MDHTVLPAITLMPAYLSSYHSAFHEFLSLPFCLLRQYIEGIQFSTHDLTNFSVFVGWCSSSFCFHPLCPKPLEWIGVQSNWFSLTFSRSTFWTFGQSSFTDLDFADDVSLLVELLELFVPILETIASEAASLGFEVNWQKTKVQALGCREDMPLTIKVQGHDVMVV